jgi:3-hydroxyisobutyrate dehydrogenase
MRAWFIGLGAMGRTMAERLISQGVGLTVWNRTPSKAEGLGADVASCPAEVFEREEVVILNLFDSEAVSDVLTGEDGFLSCEADLSGSLVIDTSTNHHRSVGLFSEIVAGSGAEYLEAPVLGSVMPAREGRLTALAGGSRAAYERALHYLDKLASTVFHLEDVGAAARMKLVNNLVLATYMAGLAEALVLAEDSGISREGALEILGAGAAQGLVFNAKRQKLLNDDYSTHFSSEAIYKDLHYAQDLAREIGRPLFTAGAVKELYAMAMAGGIGAEDFSALVKVFRSFSPEADA